MISSTVILIFPIIGSVRKATVIIIVLQFNFITFYSKPCVFYYYYIFEAILNDKIYWKSPDCVKIIFRNFFPVLCQRSFSQGSTTSSKKISGSWSRQVTLTLCWKICSIIIIVSVRAVWSVKSHKGKIIEHLNISFFSFEQSLI